MKSKFLFKPFNLFRKIFTYSVADCNDNQNEKQISLVLTTDKNSPGNIYGGLWSISVKDNQTLVIEFFEELGFMEISIQNQYGNEVYELATPTVPTLHVIIEMKDWFQGYYMVQIQNGIVKEISFILISENKLSEPDKMELYQLDLDRVV